MPKPTPLQIALAICRHNPSAGRATHANNDTEHRAERLVKLGYIVKGDPYGWGSGRNKAVATILCEPRGGKDDCEPPFYHWGYHWLDQSCAASDELDGHFIEAVNDAVHLVWPV